MGIEHEGLDGNCAKVDVHFSHILFKPLLSQRQSVRIFDSVIGTRALARLARVTRSSTYPRHGPGH